MSSWSERHSTRLSFASRKAISNDSPPLRLFRIFTLPRPVIVPERLNSATSTSLASWLIGDFLWQNICKRDVLATTKLLESADVKGSHNAWVTPEGGIRSV